MLVIKNSKKEIVSIGQYKILDILQTNDDKDIYHVQDLKKPFKEFTLRILKAHQNAKLINSEIEVLNILNKYEEILNFYNVQIVADKLVFLFDYAKGNNLQEIIEKNKNFFDQEKVMLFVDNILTILNIYRKHNILHNNINMENIIFDGDKYHLIGLSKSSVCFTKNNKFDNSFDMNSFSTILTSIIDGKSDINIQKLEELINTYFLKLDK
ncbi:MAG: protein kinase [Campylobacterota bacterium]|nr:protein kinase [Campylobacterota bacterium]